MKKISLALSLILMLSLCLGILSSCEIGQGGAKTTDEVTVKPTESLTAAPTDEPTDSTTDEPTAAPTDSTTDELTAAPTDSTTDESTAAPTDSATDKPDEPELKVLELGWNYGYVGSSTNGNYKNVFNPTGRYYSTSDIICIEKAGTVITFVDDDTGSNGDKNFASKSAYVISSWKKDGDFWALDISATNIPGAGKNSNEVATVADGKATYTYTTTKDNENIRLCYRSGATDSFVPTYPTVYCKATGKITTEKATSPTWASDESIKAFLDESKKTTNYTSLEGITMNVIGDSYFAGHSLDSKFVWPSLLAQKYNMKFENYGKNGSTISNYVTTKNPMVSRYGQMADNDPDIVIIEGGKNDYNQSAPIGADGSTKTTDFKGAVRTVIEGVKKKYPNALVICVTVWNVGGGANSQGEYVKDYGDAMIAVCRELGVPCFNAMDTSVCPVDMQSSTFRAKYCMTASDISHLNVEGHKLVLPAFEKFIADSYNAFLAAKK